MDASSGAAGDALASDGVRAGGGISRGERRIALWIGVTTLLLFLPLQHGHFKGSDELAVFEMTRSIFEHGDLAVPALRHTEVGRSQQRYSYFAPGQSVLALPLFALAIPLRAVLPDELVRGFAGPPNRRGIYRFGGEIENRLVGLYAPLTTALLMALFYAFQRQLGIARPTAAALALGLALGTHTLVMSTYFLRHTSESITMLGALFFFHRYAGGGPLRSLACGAAIASLTLLVRVPASIMAPALAGYLLYALHTRGDLQGGLARLMPALVAIAVPIAIALCLHMLVSQLKWETWLSSPMVAQEGRMTSPLLRGLAGLLISPGSSVFVYSPLLLLAPAGLVTLWRRNRPDALVVLALAATLLCFYAKFDGWSGLWSAPGPRYMYPLVPLLLLPLGLFIDDLPARRRRLVWAAVAGLTMAGLWVGLVSIVVRWGSVPTLAGYPILGPDQSDFLFQTARSPVVVMSGLLLEGGPLDSWLVDLWRGWPGFEGRPGTVIALMLAWLALLLASGRWLVRAVYAPESTST